MQQSQRNLMPQRLKLTATNEAEEEKVQETKKETKRTKTSQQRIFPFAIENYLVTK
jgi:hypothetical protein